MTEQNLGIKNRYDTRGGNVLVAIMGSAVEYASLILGVYSALQEKPNLDLVVLSGLAFVAGKVLQAAGQDIQARDRFSELEDRLRGK